MVRMRSTKCIVLATLKFSIGKAISVRRRKSGIIDEQRDHAEGQYAAKYPERRANFAGSS
jgi:hypothetical protein